MVSLTACGSNSNNTSQNTSQNELIQEVSENNVEDEKTVDSKEEKESDIKSNEDKTTKKKEKESKESESSVNEETTSENDVKNTDKKESVAETTSNEKTADTNKEPDKPEATAEPTTAPVQLQTFNVNITATDFVVTDNGPVNEVVDFGNFIITINGDAHVVSELSGWALKDYSDGSYDVNILVPLAEQDANNTYNFEIKCPDSIKNGTITNVNDGYYPFSFTVNNGTISGTVTAVTEQVVVEGSSIWVFFNVKLN